MPALSTAYTEIMAPITSLEHLKLTEIKCIPTLGKQMEVGPTKRTQLFLLSQAQSTSSINLGEPKTFFCCFSQIKYPIR